MSPNKIYAIHENEDIEAAQVGPMSTGLLETIMETN